MTKDEQRKKAEVFRALHPAPPILILPNAWEGGSARLFEVEGFKAVATTSAGAAATLGQPDGQRMSPEENVAVFRRLANHVDVPISANKGAGYATSADGVARSMRTVLHAGAARLLRETSALNLAYLGHAEP